MHTLIYGPYYAKQIALVSQVRKIFEQTDGVVDTDWSVAAPETANSLNVYPARAALAGLTPQTISNNVDKAVTGQDIGLLHDARSREDVRIYPQLGRLLRIGMDGVRNIQLVIMTGKPVAIGSVTSQSSGTVEQTIQHKNLLPVVYVLGDVACAAESPVYVNFKMQDQVAKLKAPDGLAVTQYSTQLPAEMQSYSLKWDGEWQITYEVFRDLGLTFAVVLALIYIFVVGWFRSFLTPLVVMAPIPLTLVGILPGTHYLGRFSLPPP